MTSSSKKKGKVLKRRLSTCQGHHVQQQNAYNTRYSQAVSHPSTNRALCCLTSVIGREPVYSAWYGRRQRTSLLNLFKSKQWRHRLNLFFFSSSGNAPPTSMEWGSSFRCSWLLFPSDRQSDETGLAWTPTKRLCRWSSCWTILRY